MPHKRGGLIGLGETDDPEDIYIMERITQVLRESGFQGPITPEIVEQLRGREDIMRTIYGEEVAEEEEN